MENILKFLPIIVDIIIVILIILAFKKGYKKGLVQIILELAAVFLIIPISMMFALPLANVAYNNIGAISKLEERVEKYVVSTLPKEEITEENTKLELSSQTPKIISNIINNSIKESKNKAQEEIAKTATKNITRLAIQALFVFIFYLLISFVIFIFKGTIIKLVDMIPLVNSVNGLAGSILEVVKIISIVFISLYLIRIFSGATNNEHIKNSIDNSIITKTLYNNNIIDSIIK